MKNKYSQKYAKDYRLVTMLSFEALIVKKLIPIRGLADITVIFAES